jgi:hypothetical protein
MVFLKSLLSTIWMRKYAEKPIKKMIILDVLGSSILNQKLY